MTSKFFTEREAHALQVLKKSTDRTSEVLREYQRKRMVLEHHVAVREAKKLFGFVPGDNLSFKRRIGYPSREINLFGVLEDVNLGSEDTLSLKVRYRNKKVEWVHVRADGHGDRLFFDVKKVNLEDMPKVRGSYGKRENKLAVIVFTKDNTIIAGPVSAVNPPKKRSVHPIPSDGPPTGNAPEPPPGR